MKTNVFHSHYLHPSAQYATAKQLMVGLALYIAAFVAAPLAIHLMVPNDPVVSAEFGCSNGDIVARYRGRTICVTVAQQ